MKKIYRPGMTLWLLLFCLPSLAVQTDKPPLIVFAAASLTNALQEVGDAFTKDSSIPVKFSFAASSALARQIENGAPADVFFSADLEWMDYLQSRKLIQVATRHDVLGNQLVLVAPADSKIVLKIGPHFALAKTLGTGRLATGDPDSVPVGRYAREALTKLGVWNEVERRLVRTDSVRSALAFVDRGEAALGIVYAMACNSLKIMNKNSLSTDLVCNNTNSRDRRRDSYPQMRLVGDNTICIDTVGENTNSSAWWVITRRRAHRSSPSAIRAKDTVRAFAHVKPFWWPN
jgi:molybdate transport system substrate-binding protein